MTPSGTTSAAPARGSCVSTTTRHASRSDDALPRCSRHDVVLALLRSVAAADHEEGLKYATAAVETAVAHGMVQTVAAQGRVAVELVERCAWRAPAGWLDRVRRASVNTLGDRARRPIGTGGRDRAADRSRTRRDAVPAEPADAAGDRQRAVHLDEHAEVPPQGHLSQARCQLARRGRGNRAADPQSDEK